MGSTVVIADSGSTKTDWRLVDKDGKQLEFSTSGLNPFYQTEDEIISVLRNSFLQEYGSSLEALYFYGAGCLAGNAHDKMQRSLEAFVNKGHVFVSDDLMAAARSTLKHIAGIACILGTGSNSCFYDGAKIVSRIPTMGFILGDEGSGAVMGKKLVNRYFKKEMPADIQEAFTLKYGLKIEELLQKVYREPFPNRYLAGFTYFLSAQPEHPWIKNFVKECFQEFIQKNVAKYVNYKTLPVSFTGSVAEVFRKVLEEVLKKEEIQCGGILEKPIDALVDFHMLG